MKHVSQAYTSKRRILIEVLPVPNAYTNGSIIKALCPSKRIWQNEYMHHLIWYTHWGQEVPQ